VPRARCCSAVCLCCVLVGSRFDGFVMVRSGLASIDRSIPFVGRPAFPFIGQGKAQVTAKGKRRTRESRRPSESSGPSYPSYGSRRPCRCQHGRLHVVALSVTVAMPRRRRCSTEPKPLENNMIEELDRLLFIFILNIFIRIGVCFVGFYKIPPFVRKRITVNVR